MVEVEGASEEAAAGAGVLARGGSQAAKLVRAEQGEVVAGEGVAVGEGAGAVLVVVLDGEGAVLQVGGLVAPALTADGVAAAAEQPQSSGAGEAAGGWAGRAAVFSEGAGGRVGEGGGAAERAQLAGGAPGGIGVGGGAGSRAQEPALAAGEGEAAGLAGAVWREGHARKDTWEGERADADGAGDGRELALSFGRGELQLIVAELVAVAKVERGGVVDEAAAGGVIGVWLDLPGLADRAVGAGAAPVERAAGGHGGVEGGAGGLVDGAVGDLDLDGAAVVGGPRGLGARAAEEQDGGPDAAHAGATVTRGAALAQRGRLGGVEVGAGGVVAHGHTGGEGEEELAP